MSLGVWEQPEESRSSLPAALLSDALTLFGLPTSRRFRPQTAVEALAAEPATALWGRIYRESPGALPAFDVLTQERQIYLLGCGYSLTEFLLGAAGRKGTEQEWSIGAIANLLLVEFDRQVDKPLRRDRQVIAPPCLVDYYHLQLSQCGIGLEQKPGLQSVLDRAFEALIKTGPPREEFRWKFWLRKCALPFVLMSVPAWNDVSWRSKAYLHWVYRLGYFLGAVDDSVDYEADIDAKQPNIWENRQHDRFALRIAKLGAEVVETWRKMAAAENVARERVEQLEEVFLFHVNGWLKSAA